MSTAHGGKGGAIVNVSSMAATIGGRPGASTYAASKGAVDVFTTGFAREVAAEGVRANVVRPGITDTEMIEQIRDGRAAPKSKRRSPCSVTAIRPRLRAIVWLLSDKASYVSGARLNVGGGGFHVGSPIG